MLFATAAEAQHISIGGNVYGGGNEGNVGGNTTVTLRAGDLNKVFGGARMADIDGRAFVNVDGEHASDFILANYVYGGNDISGTIGKKTGTSNAVATLPDELTSAGENNIDASWDAYVRISNPTNTRVADGVTKTLEILIGQVFAGGNGDYDYDNVDGTHTIYKKGHKGDNNYLIASTTEDFNLPELRKTYLEILGASIGYAFGGGNNATVTEKTVIHVANTSEVVTSIKVQVDGTWKELLSAERVAMMDFNPGYTDITSDAFQIGNMFGGNNMAAMAIRPTWNLKTGKIRNLYSGGNKGDMTSPVGLLLEIPATSSITVNNVYGGCRMADVRPMVGNTDVSWNDIQLPDVDENGQPKYRFPKGLSARVLVRGGNINNVYGGNDISGRVWGGNAVGIYTTIRGDVYGGGNGSYPYTDNAALINDQTYGDLYYTVPAGKTSVEALNDFRPNAEQVSIRVAGTDAAHPTIIHGAIYLGGNSATLKAAPEKKPMLELKIGSYVYADKVFLGNNGEGMVTTHGTDTHQYQEGVLRTYKRQINELVSDTYTASSKFNSMDLKNEPATFRKYMEGAAMSLMPSVVFDKKNPDGSGDPATYIPYTSYFGSFYCGGNVGSMISAGTNTIKFDYPVIIYDKLVGGCNNAYVPQTAFNAACQGGIIGSESEQESFVDGAGNIKDRLILNLSGLKIEPKRWAVERDGNYDKVLTDGHETYLLTDSEEGYPGHPYLEWNTVDSRYYNETTKTYKEVAPVTEGSGATNENDEYRRLVGGNIYGGCCESGVVNGNVVINVNATLVERDKVFDQVERDNETGEDALQGNTYNITSRKTGVILDYQGMDVLGSALNVFAGGKGQDTEIWGSTTVNLNSGYVFQVFGGSEEGAIGRRPNNNKDDNGRYTYTYDAKYSTYINLSGSVEGKSKAAYMGEDMAEAEFLYGGGFLGAIAGDTHVNLGNGRIYESFGGSCNADIQGHTETIIGANGGFPYVRDHVYGGNDLGGKILGSANFEGRVRTTANGGYDAIGKVSNKAMLTASTYMEYNQGRVKNIFGGCYGVYDYTDELYRQYFKEDGTAQTGYSKPFLGNAFVNFRPSLNSNSLNSVAKIYGAGQGYFG